MTPQPLVRNSNPGPPLMFSGTLLPLSLADALCWLSMIPGWLESGISREAQEVGILLPQQYVWLPAVLGCLGSIVVDIEVVVRNLAATSDQAIQEKHDLIQGSVRATAEPNLIGF